MTGTALIVEDHPEQADLVARILSLRHTQSSSPKRRDGSADPRESVPDIVLLDLMLPDINGFDVCRAAPYGPRHDADPDRHAHGAQ